MLALPLGQISFVVLAARSILGISSRIDRSTEWLEHPGIGILEWLYRDQFVILVYVVLLCSVAVHMCMLASGLHAL